jgi:hypothetical protein
VVRARIEDFEVGQPAAFSKTFTEDDMRRFIEERAKRGCFASSRRRCVLRLTEH